MPFVSESSQISDQFTKTDSVLPGLILLRHTQMELFTKTDGDEDGQLRFLPSTTILMKDGKPQDLLLVGHGTIDGEDRDVFALPWVSRAAGGARTHYYFLDSQGKHKTTAYDKVQKWLPGFWTAQITNGEFDEQKTRAQRILSLFHNKESLEQAMSTVFNTNNRVTEREIIGAEYVDDDDDSGKELREQLADEDDFDSLFDDSQAESEDGALSSLDDDDRATQDKLMVSGSSALSDQDQQSNPEKASSPAPSEVRMQAVRPVLQGVMHRTPVGQFKRAVSESSDDFTPAQQHKRLKVRRTASTAKGRTQDTERKRSGPQPSRLANIAKDWGVDINWLNTTFGGEILQQAHFVSALKKWIKAHPKMLAQDALAHFQRRRNIRLSGKVRRLGPVPMHEWTAADIRIDGDNDDDDDDEALSATATAPAARPTASSRTTPLMASVAAQAQNPVSGSDDFHLQKERAIRRKMLDSRLENVAQMWKVDRNWLTTRFDGGVLQTQHFIITLYKFVKAHPTISAQNAFEHFQRRRDLRRSGKLGGNASLNPANLWQAADLRLDEENEEEAESASMSAPPASGAVSAALRSSVSARPSASSPVRTPVVPHDTASMLSKLATAWPSSMGSMSSKPNSITTTLSPQPGRLNSTPSTSIRHTTSHTPQPGTLLSTPSTSLQNTTAHTTPTVEVPMTEAEAAGILYSPMTTGGLDQFKKVQRAVGVLFGKTPPLHIIQIAVGRLRFSKDPNKCIDEDPVYRAWMDANV